MGMVKGIAADQFPPQSEFVGCRVGVVFNYDTSIEVYGRIIRQDTEHPHETIILLDDGRPLRSAECQYRPLPPYPESVLAVLRATLRPTDSPEASRSLPRTADRPDDPAPRPGPEPTA